MMNAKKGLAVLALASLPFFTMGAADPDVVVPDPLAGVDGPRTTVTSEAQMTAPTVQTSETAARFAQWYTAHYRTIYQQDGESRTAKDFAQNELQRALDMRLGLYVHSHRWTAESYGTKVLTQVRNDLLETVAQRPENLQEAILDVERRNVADVGDPEMRSYVDTLIYYSLERTLIQAAKQDRPG